MTDPKSQESRAIELLAMQEATYGTYALSKSLVTSNNPVDNAALAAGCFERAAALIRRSISSTTQPNESNT